MSPYLSAYTALAFAWLRDDGHAIPEAVETKLHGYLDAFLKRDVAPDFYTRGMASTVRAVALAALAKRGKVTLADLAALPRARRVHEPVRQGALPAGRARRRGRRDDRARGRSRSFCRSSVRSGGKISFNEVLDDGYLRISATPLELQLRDLERARRDRRACATAQIGIAGDVPFELVRVITQARGNRDHWENTQENMFCMNSLLDYAQRYESRDAGDACSRDRRAARRSAWRSSGACATRPSRSSRPIGPTDPGTRTQLTIERTRRRPALLLGAHALRADGRRGHRGQRRHRPAPRVQRATRRAVGAAREPDARFGAASSCASISTSRCRRRATSSSSTIPCRAASSP